jgi:hypothetical protein
MSIGVAMPLPGSGMSMVLAVDVGVLRRRAEAALKAAATIGCIPDVTHGPLTLGSPRVRTGSATFETDDDRVLFVLDVTLRADPLGTAVVLSSDARLRLEIGAEPAGVGDRQVAIGVSYDRFELGEGSFPPEAGPAFDALVAQLLEPQLGALAITVPFGDALPDGAAITAPVEVKVAAGAPATSGSTLLFGLAVDADPGTDPVGFHDWTADPLAQVTADWRAEIDSGLVRDRAAEVLAELDLTDGSPGGIDSWLMTTSTAMLWSGDPITVQTHGQTDVILAGYPQHPLWFVVEGLYATGWPIALSVFAVGHADLVVDPDAGELLVVPHIFHAGWLAFRIVVEDQPDPMPMMATDLGGGLVLDGLTFDPHRLVLLGRDDHHGEPGGGKLVVPAEIVTEHRQQVSGGLCKKITSIGTIRADGTVVTATGVGNTGTAPLWVCGVDVPAGGPFSVVQGQAADPAGDTALALPAWIAPGGSLSFLVLMQVGVDDHDEHQTTLHVRCDDFDTPRATVPVRGRRHAPDGLALTNGQHDQLHGELLCLGRPERLDPREWFDVFAGMVRGIDRLIDVTRPVDTFVDISVRGFGVDGAIVVRDGRGAAVALTNVIGGLHHLTVPLDRPEQLRFAWSGDRRVGLGDVRMVIGVLEPVAEHDLDHPPTTVTDADGVLFAASDGGVRLWALRDDGPTGFVRVPGVQAIDAAGGMLVVRTEDRLELYDVRDPQVPRRAGTIPLGARSSFRLLPGHLVVMDDERVRVHRVTADGGSNGDAEVAVTSPLSLLVPWHAGVAVLGAHDGLLLGGLGPAELASGRAVPRDRLPEALRLAWDTRIDDRTARSGTPNGAHVVRATDRGVSVLRRRHGTVAFDRDAVAAFLREHQAG